MTDLEPIVPTGSVDAGGKRIVQRLLLISWTRGQKVTDELARSFAGEAVYIYPAARFGVVIRYAVSTLLTLWELFSRRPDVVFVVAPPNIALVPVVVYRELWRRSLQVVVNAHTGAIIDRKWRWTHGLLRAVIRSSRPTWLMVTLGELWERLDVPEERVLVLPNPLPAVQLTAAASQDYCFVVSSYMDDEPVSELVAAARLLPHRTFHVSGRVPERLAPLLATLPGNFVPTGFLPDDEYWRTLSESAVVIVLTTRELTMMWGACEAVAAEVPMILSDSPGLREFFSTGAIFTVNEPTAIAAAVEIAFEQRLALRDGVRRLKELRRAEWAKHVARTRELLGLSA